jgi:uncharacterized repeat protein (TIGR01451 family)
MARDYTHNKPGTSNAREQSPIMARFTSRLLPVAGFILATCCVILPPAWGQVLFDNTKAETAGNADWVIDTHQPIPSPSITGITSSTSESYWTGALSSWGVALAKLRNLGQISLPGNGLETLPSTGSITYGNSSNLQDLSHYQVYVVCEPNIRFTDAEKTAILNFVANGGGLFMVADHNGSDRNNDGIDSLAVWNDLMYTNSVQTNPFGFRINADDVTPSVTTVDSSPANPLIHGIAGTVTTLQYASGATMTINNTTTTHAAVWSSSSATGVMALYGTYGSGRFVAIGDSSVVEDATSEPGHTTYAGWTTPVDNGYCAINGTVWLLGGGSTNPMPPTATTGTATGVGTTTATLNGTVNPNGQTTTVHFDYGLTTSYGSNASVPGNLTGTTAQAVAASITGLTVGTIYHFRVTATNALGSTNGLDQMFTTATVGVPNLVITATHNGSFTQGDTGDVYTITVTNIGTAPSSGTVTVVDTLPAGLTATAISGAGWTTNLAALKCTRTDALPGGSAYPAITVIVSVATNAPASVINTAIVSGGGDTNSANNTASDPTTINTSGAGGGTNYSGVLAGWDVSGQSNFGISPLAPTTNAPNLTVSGLTRGSGVGTSGSASAKAWGGNTWNSTSEANAIAANAFATFSIAAKAGSMVSFSSINEFDYRRSSSGPPNGELQYQVGAGAFTDIAPVSYTSTTGASLAPIGLSGISALQNVAAGITVTFRIVNWGATSSGGTWYILDVAGSSAPDLAISGTVSPISPPPVADLVLATTHAGVFTQGDVGDSYTITVTNIGTAATLGTVRVTDALPAGLTPTSIGGTGWTANLTNLTCTRSDALPAGASYPPITVTVNISPDAPASVTNIATVSGGGDVSPANNTASDPTTIVPLTPVEGWRLLWFGTTTNSGAAADTAVATSDGMANLLKYALGLNPLVATNDPVTGDISTGFLRLTAPKNAQATDVTFHVEVTSDVTAASWTANGTTMDINTATLLQVHANTPVASSDGAFIRLRISRP